MSSLTVQCSMQQPEPGLSWGSARALPAPAVYKGKAEEDLTQTFTCSFLWDQDTQLKSFKAALLKAKEHFVNN